MVDLNLLVKSMLNSVQQGIGFVKHVEKRDSHKLLVQGPYSCFFRSRLSAKMTGLPRDISARKKKTVCACT